MPAPALPRMPLALLPISICHIPSVASTLSPLSRSLCPLSVVGVCAFCLFLAAAILVWFGFSFSFLSFFYCFVALPAPVCISISISAVGGICHRLLQLQLPRRLLRMTSCLNNCAFNANTCKAKRTIMDKMEKQQEKSAKLTIDTNLNIL